MATAATNSKTRCFTCGKDKVVYLCEGCSKKFCLTDLPKHHQENEQELDKIITDCDVLQQNIIEQKANIGDHPLMERVNQWERNSIEKIKETAAECREKLAESIRGMIIEIEKRLNKSINQVRQIRQDNDFNEIHLNKLRAQLAALKNVFLQPRNISIVEEPTSFINKISIAATIPMSNLVIPPVNAQWSQNGKTVAGGNGQGNATNQLYYPFGLCVDDDDQTLIIADFWNHRIIQWKKNGTNGEVITGGKGQGNQLDQLNRPTDVLIDKETDSLIIADYGNRRVIRWSRLMGTTQGEVLIDNIACYGLALDDRRYLYVSDEDKHEVRRYPLSYDKNGVVVAGGNGRGERLNQLNKPRYLLVDRQQNLYVSDSDNHRVMKWNKDAKEGIVVAGGKGPGSALTQLSHPNGLFVDNLGTLYIADLGNDRVLRWPLGAKQGTVIAGGNDQGAGVNQFNWPISLSFDTHGNLYIVDNQNNRVQRFSIE